MDPVPGSIDSSGVMPTRPPPCSHYAAYHAKRISPPLPPAAREASSGRAIGGEVGLLAASDLRLSLQPGGPDRPPGSAVREGQGAGVEAVEAEQGHGGVIDAGQGHAGAKGSRQQLRAMGGRGAGEGDGGHAALDHAAPLHARGGFLPYEAALLEIDAAEEIEIGFDGVGGLDAPVFGAWNTQGQTMRRIVRFGPAGRAIRRGGAVAAKAQVREAWIDAPPRRGRVHAPQSLDSQIRGGNIHLGAQAV